MRLGSAMEDGFSYFWRFLLTLATVLFAAMASYCFFYQHGAFTGHWYWVNWGIEVAVECRT